MAERGISQETSVTSGSAVDEKGPASAPSESEVIQQLYQELLGKTSQYLKSEFEGIFDFITLSKVVFSF